MTWKQLPLKVKILIGAVTSLALPIVASAAWDLIGTPPPNPIYWVILLLLTLATVPAFLVLMPVSTMIGIGDAFIMAVAMLYGTSPCIITTLCHTVAASYFVPNRPKVHSYKAVFNTASMICAAWLYSEVYQYLNGILINNRELRILLPAVALTITFFLFNSLVTSAAIAWSMGDRILRFWIKYCLPLSIDFSVSAVCAVIIVSVNELHPLAPLGAAPIVGLIWGWNRANKSKADQAERHLREQEQLYFRTVETLALAVDAKDQTTYGHIRRVRAYALGLARLSGVTDTNELKAIETGSLLHDIGKLAIEDYILNKPGRLSKQEFEKMKVHAAAGDEILQQVQFPFPVAKYVRCHHERWDGNGYPDGLKGEEIPLGARILSIADAYDAIRSTRPYKTAFGIDDSMELLRSQSGSNYDPKLIEIFIAHVAELESAADEAARNISELSFRKYFEKLDGAETQNDALALDESPSFKASEELVRLFEFCGGVGRSLGLPDALPILARRMKQIVPYNTCAFFLCQEDGSIRAEYACGEFAECLQGICMGLGKGISGWAAAYKRVMINTGPALEFQGIEGNFSALKDAMVVPLLQEDDCIGTISLYSQTSSFYTPSHLSLMQTLAEQVAPLIRAAGKSDLPEEKSLLDPVTETHRFAYLSVAGAQVLTHAQKTEAPLSLLYLEIRNFQQIVTLYGVATGDLILRKVADILRAELRQTDVLVRYGPHGFAALLPGVRNPQALRYVHRLLQQIKSTPNNLASGNTSFITCQAGIAAYPSDGATLLGLLQAAQKALNEQARLSGSQALASEGNVLEFPPRL